VRDRVGSATFAALSELRDFYYASWCERQNPTPPILYHYTNSAGAAGILRSGKIWATSALHLNDEQELLHASALLKDVLRRRFERATTREERLLLSPQQHTVDMTAPDFIQYFLASFSGTEDDLPQWRQYADGGYGVALGFDGPSVATLSHGRVIKPNFSMAEVCYDKAIQTEWFESMVDQWFTRARLIVRQHIKSAYNREYFLSGVSAYLAVCACEYFAAMKVPHFRSENEWRLAHAHPPERPDCRVLTRDRRGVVPYIELDLCIRERLPLVVVWLGPGFRTDEARGRLRELLDAEGYASVPIRQSEIPLRLDQRIPAF